MDNNITYLFTRQLIAMARKYSPYCWCSIEVELGEEIQKHNFSDIHLEPMTAIDDHDRITCYQLWDIKDWQARPSHDPQWRQATADRQLHEARSTSSNARIREDIFLARVRSKRPDLIGKFGADKLLKLFRLSASINEEKTLIEKLKI